MTEQDDRPSDSAVAEFPLHRLTQDILVNVIANLIAAALIYLFGAVVGFFPSEPRAILVAAGFLTMVLGLLAFVVGKTYSLSKKQQKQDASLFFRHQHFPGQLDLYSCGILSRSTVLVGTYWLPTNGVGRPAA